MACDYRSRHAVYWTVWNCLGNHRRIPRTGYGRRGDFTRGGSRNFRSSGHNRRRPRRRHSGRDRLQPDHWLDSRNGLAQRRLHPGDAQSGGAPAGAATNRGEALMAFTSSNGRTQSALADINITPLVDVVLVLLIIFMVTAPVLQSGIEVNVPHTRTVKEITEERLVISIDKSQRVFLGNDPININQIGATLKRKIRDPQHQSIYLRSDEDVPFGAFATVMDAIKQSGISNVSIVTQPIDAHSGGH